MAVRLSAVSTHWLRHGSAKPKPPVFSAPAAAADLEPDPNSAGGIRIAGLGGLWQAIVLGFAGLDLKRRHAWRRPEASAAVAKPVIPRVLRGRSVTIGTLAKHRAGDAGRGRRDGDADRS